MTNRDYGKFYKVWKNMRQRCNNPKYKGFNYYGGRGIKICSRWDNFLNFVVDMYPTYQEGLSIERINNNGNYTPKNCLWATRTQQNNNTRKNKFITFEGITKTLSEWARELGIKRSTLAQRFYVYKWSIEKCLMKGGQIGNI